MKTAQIVNQKPKHQDFGAPENLRIENREQLENLLDESLRDTRKGYTISEIKTKFTRSRERAVI